MRADVSIMVAGFEKKIKLLPRYRYERARLCLKIAFTI